MICACTCETDKDEMRILRACALHEKWRVEQGAWQCACRECVQSRRQLEALAKAQGQRQTPNP